MEVVSDTTTSSDASKGFTRMVSDLGKKLARRQGPEELVQRNILTEDELSPEFSNVIVQTKAALEAEKTKDVLNRRIGNRPTKVDLKLRNILRVDSSDRIDQQSLAFEPSLDFEKTRSDIKSILRNRPQKASLEEANILKGGNLDPSIVAKQEALKRQQLVDVLDSRLRDRPDTEQLQERRILVFAETVEVLPTFRKSEYNRKPDTNATFRKLTPQMKVQIREELNTYKKHEMPVHENSLRNTCFH